MDDSGITFSILSHVGTFCSILPRCRPRLRIYCGRRKEGGRCSNGKTYKLTNRSSGGDRAKAQLRDPRAIERYLATYQAERKRLAAKGIRKRAALERTLGQAKREIDRIVDQIARGTISEEEARSRLPDLRRRRDDAQAELAVLAPPAKMVALHPSIVARYLASIEDLAGALSRRSVDSGEEIAAALRELIAQVVVLPAGRDEPRIEVTGRLAKLAGANLFPQASLTTVVAGARFGFTHRPAPFRLLGRAGEAAVRQP